jgi:SWI/SNF-related matrix-associated actin-dependent regulator of chromatin subfamily A-like protein 1
MLKDYQEAGVAAIIRQGGNLILADEPGLGKTIQCLTAVSRQRWKPVLIVCPSTAKGVWHGEIRKWLGFDVSIDVLEGRRAVYRVTKDFTIVNYTILDDWLTHINVLIKPDIVIFDEGHALVNAATTQSKAAAAIESRRKLIVTGTPVLNVAEDLAALQKLCGSRVIVRRLKEAVLPDLPIMTREVVKVEISNRGEYEYAKGAFLSWLADQGDQIRLSNAIRAEALVKVGYLKQLIGVGKIRAVEEFVQSLGDRKTIVFATHRAVVDALGTGCVIDGSRTARQRTAAIDQFNRPDGPDRLVANIVSGGTAWNGTVSSTVVIAELPWTHAKLEQAEKRVDRIGQTVAPVSYVLIASHTLEERFWEIIEGKRDLSAALLEDYSRGVPAKSWWGSIFGG